MIGRISKGTSFVGALRYDMEKEGASVLDTNLASDQSDWNALASEMDVMAESNTRCQKSCLHFSLSAPDGERLTDEQWKEAAQTAMKELDLEDHQYVVTRHTDAGHDHIHIVANRIGPDGKAWSDSNDYARIKEASRAVENKLGLEKYDEHSATKDGRFESVKDDLNESIKAAGSRGYDGFKAEMNERGYDVIENRQSTGRLAGIKIRSQIDGKTWKASELQKGGARGIEMRLESGKERAEKEAAFQQEREKAQKQREQEKAKQQASRSGGRAASGAINNAVGYNPVSGVINKMTSILGQSMPIPKPKATTKSAEANEATSDPQTEKAKADLKASIDAAGTGGHEKFKNEMVKRGYDVIESKDADGKIKDLRFKSKDGKEWKAKELRKGGAWTIDKDLDRSKTRALNKEKAVATSFSRTAGSGAANSIGKVLGSNPVSGIAGKLAGTLIKSTPTQSKPKQKER